MLAKEISLSGKKRVRHNPKQIVEKLQEADRLLNAGQSVGQVLQALGISEATYHRWRQQYGGMKASEAKRLKELEQENAGSSGCWPMRTWTTTSSSVRWTTWETGKPDTSWRDRCAGATITSGGQ